MDYLVRKLSAVKEIEKALDVISAQASSLYARVDGIVEDEAENALKAFARTEADAVLLGDNEGGVAMAAYLPQYEGLFIEHGGFMPLGSFESMVAAEADLVSEGDVAWGEQLRTAFAKAIEQLDAALIEGRKHPFD